MRRLRSSIGVLQGSRILFSDFADGGPMWTGQGNREAKFTVTFEEAFEAAPSVMVGLSMWDMDNRTNLRADITADQITPQGFQLVFRTWGDSRIARVRADWTAIGPLVDEDAWQVD